MGLRGRGRATEKKVTKKDLQVTVNHGIMDSNKEAAMSGEGGKKDGRKAERDF